MTTAIPITGEITAESVMAARLEILRNHDRPITLAINSHGGKLYEATKLCDAIRQHGRINAQVTGQASSAASVIAFACNRIDIDKGAFMHLHLPHYDGRRTAETLQEKVALDIGGWQVMTTYIERLRNDRDLKFINEAVADGITLNADHVCLFFDRCYIKEV